MNSPLIWESKYESNIKFRGILFLNTWNQWTRSYDYEFWFNINLFKHERQHNGKGYQETHSHEKNEVQTVK